MKIVRMSPCAQDLIQASHHRWSTSLTHFGNDAKGRKQGTCIRKNYSPKGGHKDEKAICAFALLAMALALVFSASRGLLAQRAPEKLSNIPTSNGAVAELQKTKAYLTLVNHDFSGHRDDAINAVEEAIKQLKLAEQFDNK